MYNVNYTLPVNTYENRIFWMDNEEDFYMMPKYHP